MNLPKRHSIKIVLIQNIFPHLPDLHLKTTIKTKSRYKMLEGRGIVGHNKNTFCKCTIIPSH